MLDWTSKVVATPLGFVLPEEIPELLTFYDWEYCHDTVSKWNTTFVLLRDKFDLKVFQCTSYFGDIKQDIYIK